MNPRSNPRLSLNTTTIPRSIPSPHHSNLIPKIMISSTVILFSIVLLILILHFYVRWHVLRRAARRARRIRQLIFAGDTRSAATTTHAVDPSILKSLPVLLFSGDGDLKECSVCLNEFLDGEKIRHLPRCGHSFHIECIDMWFSSHSSCPLCRSAVDSVPDLCSSCRGEEVIGSPEMDSGAGEVVIEIPAGLIGEEGLGLGRRRGNLIWTSGRVLCLFLRSLTLGIWRKRVDGVVTEMEVNGGEAVVAPPAVSPLTAI